MGKIREREPKEDLKAEIARLTEENESLKREHSDAEAHWRLTRREMMAQIDILRAVIRDIGGAQHPLGRLPRFLRADGRNGMVD